MFRSITLFLLSLALLSLTAPTWATVIYVSGDQTGTWAADTVIVTGEVRVPPGQSLTISPGVEVLFSVYCKLIVDNGATLRAVGTAADSIRFDVLPPDTAWHGIRFLSASDFSRIECCYLTHGYAAGPDEDCRGGAIYCSNSNPTISYNTIEDNYAFGLEHYDGGGGGIYCDNHSSPLISNNTIAGNSTGGEEAEAGGIYCFHCSNPIICCNAIIENHAGADNACGGGICCDYGSNPIITNNFISANSAVDRGGGIYCFNNSDPIISNNLMSENTVNVGYSTGGGISCFSFSNPSILDNLIIGNSAGLGGGISVSLFSNPIISGNRIHENSATLEGGGIFCDASRPTISGNVISRNIANSGGGIFNTEYAEPIISNNTISGNWGGGISFDHQIYNLVNCILWENIGGQIYGGFLHVTYSNIQGGYPGTGNINAYPAFVDTAQGDYRLQWGSPCIDTGDPNPIYNDPDLTRADMGAWYYDQSLPVRILLTPYNAPIEIPAAGGSFQYAIQVTNIAATTLPVLGWCNVTLPTGPIYGPVLGPLNLSLGAGQTLSRVRTQTVPAGAPAELYHYNAFAVAMGDTSFDNFVFTKLGFGNQESGVSDWTNTGEDFVVGARHAVPVSGSGTTPTTVISPNPFNPSTAISYELRAASYVSLRVYDTAGRLVTTLVNGWREAGEHQVTFDGSALPSGVYLYRLEAGELSAVGKMVLLK